MQISFSDPMIIDFTPISYSLANRFSVSAKTPSPLKGYGSLTPLTNFRLSMSTFSDPLLVAIKFHDIHYPLQPLKRHDPHYLKLQIIGTQWPFLHQLEVNLGRSPPGTPRSHFVVILGSSRKLGFSSRFLYISPSSNYLIDTRSGEMVNIQLGRDGHPENSRNYGEGAQARK